MQELKTKSPNKQSEAGGLARVVLCREPDKRFFSGAVWGHGFFDFSKPISVLSGTKRPSRSIGQYDSDRYFLDDVPEFDA